MDMSVLLPQLLLTEAEGAYGAWVVPAMLVFVQLVHLQVAVGREGKIWEGKGSLYKER